jgi:hypothetical protein
LKRFHSSGRWFFGSHWPKSSRCEKKLFLVPPSAAEARGEFVLLDRVEQRDRLQRVARSVRALLLLGPAFVDRVLDMPDNETRTDFPDEGIAVSDRLPEVVTRVDVKERERNLRRPESLGREVRHDDRVFAAGKKQRGVLELRGGLAQDENRLGLELVELV